jgi:hypothetical protein
MSVAFFSMMVLFDFEIKKLRLQSPHWLLTKHEGMQYAVPDVDATWSSRKGRKLTIDQ